MREQELKKFYIEFVGSLPVRWGIEIEAISEEVAKEEATRSLPEFSADWSIGDGHEKVIDAGIVSVADLGEVVKDRDLGRLELEQKYSDGHSEGWGHHPIHTRDLWKYCIAEDDTVDGYWDWVYNKIQNEDEPDDSHN